MNVSRESVFVALFGLLSQLKNSPFLTVSRRWEPYQNFAPEQQPALFVMQDNQRGEQKAYGLQKWTLKASLWIYCYQGAEDDFVASTTLNNLLDLVEAAIQPAPGFERQMLGGIVQNCFIDGEIDVVEGVLGQQSVARIPITIITGD